jgi:uncharacterized membrane protein
MELNLMDLHLHPYRTPAQVRETVNRLRPNRRLLVQPQELIHELRGERTRFQQFNGWLADHVVGLAGTMIFFYGLCLLMGAWAFWESYIAGDTGFDPYPYAFLFFILGGIMQSLFVPTSLTASNRSAERDRLKDEVDHRAWSHLYDVNDEQLAILRQLADRILRSES